MNSPEDQVYIEQILAGDSTAYAPLVRKYQSRILQLCVSMLRDYKEAEDAAQEIFVKTFYALDRFKRESTFYTWLYRIASNHCLDIARKKSRHRTESWEELLESKGDEIEKLLWKNSSVETQESQETVQQVLALLDPDYCLILTLREIQGLSYDEISASLKCSLDAVKGRLKRARQDFKEKLRHFLDSERV